MKKRLLEVKEKDVLRLEKLKKTKKKLRKENF